MAIRKLWVRDTPTSTARYVGELIMERLFPTAGPVRYCRNLQNKARQPCRRTASFFSVQLFFQLLIFALIWLMKSF